MDTKREQIKMAAIYWAINKYLQKIINFQEEYFLQQIIIYRYFRYYVQRSSDEKIYMGKRRELNIVWKIYKPDRMWNEENMRPRALKTI